MPDRGHDSDDELRAAARDALSESESGVPIDDDLAAVRRRAAETPGVPGRPDTAPASASRWIAVVGIAAVLALIVGGIVLLSSRDDSATNVVTVPPIVTHDSTTVAAISVPIAVPTTLAAGTTTTAPATTQPAVTTSPTTSTTTPAPTTVPRPDRDAQVLGIPSRSLDGAPTQLAGTPDGRIVAYDPTDDALWVLDDDDQLETTLPLPESTGETVKQLVAVGPDDVAYLWFTPAGTGDPVADLVAIPLAGPTAGTIVESWPGAIDASGDSDLVRTGPGLVQSPCCGPDTVRPTPGSTTFEWVGGDGQPATWGGPTFELWLRDQGNQLVRSDASPVDPRVRTWTLPSVAYAPRGMPYVVATDDGGALMMDLDLTNTTLYIVRFQPDWSPHYGTDNADVYLLDNQHTIALMEPAGTVIVREGDQFIRRTLEQIGTPGWPGMVADDIATGAVTAPGLNDYIDEFQPAWAADSYTFALQIVQQLGANVDLSFGFEEAPDGITTITESGFLDDSVFAQQRKIRTERGDDGLLRFVDGTIAYQCQPGRGHQDFSLELCA